MSASGGIPDTDSTVPDLVRDWAAAEQANDATALDSLLADGFVGVGPAGFVLDREQWRGRFDNGLANRSLTVTDLQVHLHGTAAIIVGVQVQETSFAGVDNSGRFRLTIAAVQTPESGWRVASVHIGPLHSGPPAQPAG